MKKWLGRCDVKLYSGSWQRMLIDDNLKSKACYWEWDSLKKGRGIHTFHEQKAITFEGGDASQVLCTQPCKLGEKYYIEIEIVRSQRGAINLGVSTKAADFHHRSGFDDQGWSFSLFSGSFYHRNSWTSAGMSPFAIKAESRIGMGVDMIHKRITFFINGSQLGFYLHGISEQVFPSVSLGNVGDCVVIVPTSNIPKF